MYYSLKFNLSSGSRQPEVIQALQREGFPHIQTSYGLCVSAPTSQAELAEKLGEVASDITIETIDKDAEHTPDVQAFMTDAG